MRQVAAIPSVTQRRQLPRALRAAACIHTQKSRITVSHSSYKREEEEKEEEKFCAAAAAEEEKISEPGFSRIVNRQRIL
jgi:hypothetical protein